MRKLLQLIYLWIFFLISVPLHAAPINHVLWKIEKSGQPVSYLAGTIHLGYNGTQLPAEMKAVLLQSKALITEIVIPLNEREALAPEYAGVALKMINITNPDTARSRLGAPLYGDLKKIFTQNSELAKMLPVFDLMYPWAIYINLTAAPPAGMSAQNGIDYLLSQTAAARQIRRAGLEQYAASVALFAGIPEEILLRDLQYTVHYFAQTQKETAALADNYRSGKIARLLAEQNDEKILLQYTAPQDKVFWQNFYRETLLKQRNRAWMPKILEQLPREPTLIAVGLMHLDGEDGLIRLLRDNGYRVIPIPVRY